MASKKVPNEQKNEQEDQGIDLPEERLEKIDKVAKPKGVKKTRSKSTEAAKGKQVEKEQDAPVVAEEAPRSVNKDPLAEVRQSLLEDEVVKEKKGLFARIKTSFGNVSGSKEAEPQIEPEPAVETQENLKDLVTAPKPAKKRVNRKQEEKAINEFFADLEALASVSEEPEPDTLDILDRPRAPKPEKPAPVTHLPKKVDTKADVDFESVRDLALQEYDDSVIEAPAPPQKPLEDRVSSTIRELKPFERMLVIVVVALTVVAMLSSGIYFIGSSVSNIFPTPTPTAEPDLTKMTYPIRIILPGGWEFDLGQGSVVDGEWSPQGGEWLIGTEISRWVALPWSIQLEAVLRTLQSGDQIELMMSNYDTLPYGTYSIQELSMGDILALDARVPSLVVVLFEGESKEGLYWVVTAFPKEVEVP